MGPPPPRKRSHNYYNTGGASFRRTPMLSMGQQKHFRYSLREIFARHNLDPKIGDPLGGALFAKGSRNSLDDAKDFVEEKVREGVIKPELADDLFTLLDRYSTWR
jgi:hypothetical protein